MYIPFRFFQSALIKSGGTLSTLSRHGQREQLLRQPGGCHGVSPWPAPGSWVTLTRHFQHLLSARLLSSLYSCRCFSFHFQKFHIKCMLVTQSAQSCLSLCNPMDCSPPQAPLSIGFSRWEYCSGLPFPSLGDLPDPSIETGSPVLRADSLPSELPGKPFVVSLALIL